MIIHNNLFSLQPYLCIHGDNQRIVFLTLRHTPTHFVPEVLACSKCLIAMKKEIHTQQDGKATPPPADLVAHELESVDITKTEPNV